jgi:hypothetical protein
MEFYLYSLVCLIGVNLENFTFNHLLGTQEHKRLLEYFYICMKCFCHSIPELYVPKAMKFVMIESFTYFVNDPVSVGVYMMYW